MNEVIILAGGKGTRLQEVVSDLPKPMAPINGRPFLSYVLDDIYKQGCRRVVLSTGYMHETIEAHYGNKYNGDMEIVYSVETSPLGTGGAVKQALEMIQAEQCIVMNGDTFFNVDIGELLNKHQNWNADLTIALKEMHDFDRYGTVKTDGAKVLAFQEKTKVDKGYINGGVYAISKTIFERIPTPVAFSFEVDFISAYFNELNIMAVPFEGYFIDIGIPHDYYKAQNELKL